MVRAFAYGAISHGGPIELLLVPATAPRLVKKGLGMCYLVCGIVHINEPLLVSASDSQTERGGGGDLGSQVRISNLRGGMLISGEIGQ